ncbi:DUF2288 domain-containing protein [Alishewanella tabrizica]|uniref:DUF2288 domain-containing protein n=1 Tax=Alishewanella tabrizica TaxID=671278 RepID=A0ABQ2WGS3_9ALTE|nr:DUF2288 domain-containing protein [Alishewanella tabrizica]GGW54770.1 hypothetical protein GCM10008111_08430 [Alishewanella tabrizica]
MSSITPADAHFAEEAESPELIRAKIIAETARINWLDLQKFYAAGNVIHVEATLDLIDVAFAFHQDQASQVAAWLSSKQISRTFDGHAQAWYQAKTELWAVVVSPWVLVQDKPLTTQLN